MNTFKDLVEIRYKNVPLGIIGHFLLSGLLENKKTYFISVLTLRLLMSYIYIYGAPILDVSRSHTTTQHSR